MARKIDKRASASPPAVSSAAISRRRLLVSSAAVSLGAIEMFKRAHGLEPAATRAAGRREVRNDPESNGLMRRSVHEGKGEMDVKIFFSPDRPSKPAILLIYDIPPGASEGVHTHNIGDRKEGSFDEFYYIISGSGEMLVGGEVLSVKAGDHVFTPNGVAHGIENTAAAGNLKVYLVAVLRE